MPLHYHVYVSRLLWLYDDLIKLECVTSDIVDNLVAHLITEISIPKYLFDQVSQTLIFFLCNLALVHKCIRDINQFLIFILSRCVNGVCPCETPTIIV